MRRYAWIVIGTRFGNLRFVADDYVLQANEHEGRTDGSLPRIQDLPGWAPPPESLPNISRRQFFQAAAGRGMITQDEALAAMQHGTIPAQMQEAIDTLPHDQKFAAEMMLSGANEFERNHPMVQKFGEIMGLPAPALDEIWRYAATL